MDFFEAQARARRRTSRLIALFIVAVLGTIAAGYLGAIAILGQISPRAGYYQTGDWNVAVYGGGTKPPPRTRWWDPGLLALVTIGTTTVVGLAALYKWREFASGGGAVAESVGGRLVDPATTDGAERRLLNVVEEMAIAAGLPVPGVYLLPEETGINAFAAGLTPNDAVVAVTRGTVQKLTRDELQGVVAHEFSHILNGDMRMNLRIAAIVFGILVLGLAGRGILWSLRGVRSRGKSSGGIIALAVVTGLMLIVIGYVGYFFGRMIQAAVSRQREFLADASAVQFTRNPGGLLGALKKIGGYALGSSLQSSRSTAIGHFFFAQAFRTGLTGLWSTHPPLEERIRAIDPSFDGEMFDPPEVVDVARESFVDAGVGGVRRPVAAFASAAARIRLPATGLFGSPSLTPAQLENAQALLAATPTELRLQARTAPGASALVYGLLLDVNPLLRAKQLALIARLQPKVQDELNRLAPAVAELRPEYKLPLLQLALPAIKTLPPEEKSAFLGVLDELVHADGQVSIFEFALQRLVAHALELNATPVTTGARIQSFAAVGPEIATVLSALAHLSGGSPDGARAAFEQGLREVPLLAQAHEILPADQCHLAAVERALDRLAITTDPIRARVLAAAARVAGADSGMRVEEYELLRALAAGLDCPLPPLVAAA